MKVHFHWDRYDKSDEKSTCWVRVSQPWAGKGWGGYFIPRIGQEVLVDFLNGDPDRPLIVGRLYNDDQPIPYSRPRKAASDALDAGQQFGNFNEIMFEDKAGEEVIAIHAERDMSRSVERDDSTSVDRDQSIHRQARPDPPRRPRPQEHGDAQRDHHGGGRPEEHRQGQPEQPGGGQPGQLHRRQRHAHHWRQERGGRGRPRITTFRAGESHHGGRQQTISVTGKVTYKAAEMSFEAGHIDWMVTGASSKYITVPTGPLHLMANKIKLMSNTGIELMAVGNIDQTAIGSNTTILGPNTSGYIGTNSSANLGINRSTFMGLSIENALALAMSNVGGVLIENTLGVKLINCVAPEIKSISTADVNLTPLKTISPGGGGGPATGAAVAGALGAVAGAGSAYADIGATLKQYADAAAALEAAAQDAQAAGLPGLANRLTSLAGQTRMRRNQGILGAVPVVGTGLEVFLELFSGGDSTGSQALADGGGSSNADGTTPPSGGS